MKFVDTRKAKFSKRNDKLGDKGMAKFDYFKHEQKKHRAATIRRIKRKAK